MTKINARLIALTQPTIELKEPDAEGLLAFCARVSNPKDQDKDVGNLFNYCIRNKHWSIFEMANAVVEVEAPRDITRQLIRHRSFSFQEFSQRYSDQIEFTDRDFRRQDVKNRQNSIDDLDKSLVDEAKTAIREYVSDVSSFYTRLIFNGIAKECARVVLPEGLTMSRLYVNGTVRSWLHYLDVRDDPGVTQQEHVVLAKKIREVLEPAFPKILGEFK